MKSEAEEAKILQFEIHMAHINFMGSCIAVDPVRAKARRKFLFQLASIS